MNPAPFNADKGRNHCPVWFLDVDGVVSPFGGVPRPGMPTLLSGPFDSDLAVPYDPDVIGRIQQIHGSGLAEVRWLTTWDVEMLSDWERVGLGPFAHELVAHRGRRQWWKADVVATWMRDHPQRRIVWTDDDLTPARVARLDRARLLAIRPQPAIGLTCGELDRIEDWLAAGN